MRGALIRRRARRYPVSRRLAALQAPPGAIGAGPVRGERLFWSFGHQIGVLHDELVKGAKCIQIFL